MKCSLPTKERMLKFLYRINVGLYAIAVIIVTLNFIILFFAIRVFDNVRLEIVGY